MALGKTPWVDRTLKHNWDVLEELVPNEWLPLTLAPGELEQEGKKFGVEELGCGHYGCVMPTLARNVVAKLSSDPTEAQFVYNAIRLAEDEDDWPEGLVRYYKIVRVEGSYYNRPLYMIWREEAFDVGFLIKASRDWVYARERTYDMQMANAMSFNLYQFAVNAGAARTRLRRAKNPERMLLEARSLERWAFDRVAENMQFHGDKVDILPGQSRYRGAYAVAFSLRACEVIAEVMEHTYLSDLVGSALSYYLERGLLLADVHSGNVGKVNREGYEQVVITDPGHALVLEPFWAQPPPE